MVQNKLPVFLTMFALMAVGAAATQVVFNYCPIVLNASTEAIMTQSISNNATDSNIYACVHIAGSNVVLDCNGTTIEYGAHHHRAATETGFTGNDSVRAAINASNFGNINITGCRLNDINASGGTPVGGQDTGAINLTSVHNVIINNTIIRTNGSNGSIGIVVWNSTNVTIQNTTILVQNRNGSGSPGILMHLNFSNLLIQNNHIIVNGTGGNNSAIVLRGTGINVTIYNNSFTSNGTLDNNYGVHLNATAACAPGACTLGSIHNVNISNNTVRTMGLGNNTAVLLALGINNATVAHNILMPNGSNGDNNGVQIATSQGNNITNNTITTYGYSFNLGVWLGNQTNHNTVGNNTIITRFAVQRNNSGVLLQSILNNNTVVRNYIRTDGTFNSSGIVLHDRANNNTIINNTIHSNASAGSSYGIILGEGILVEGNNILSNTIDARGIANSSGIFLTGVSSNNTIANNTVWTHGNESGLHALRLNRSSNNSIQNNTFYANGTNISHAVLLEASSNNNSFNRNTYVALNASSHSIFILSGGDNHFANDTLNNSGQNSFWIFQNPDQKQNFSNVTFATGNGSIRWLAMVTLNASRWNITPSVINVSFNSTYVNSSNLSHANETMFNTTAQVKLLGLNFTNPEPYFDTNSTSTFEKCPGSVCTEVSFSGGAYVFDVTHFSGYSAQEGATSNTGGSSSFGSSGSSGSSAAAAATSMTTQAMTTQGLRTNQQVSFSVNNVKHTMTVAGVTATTVTVRVASVPQTLLLKKGDVREISLDNDLVPDFRITVLDIFQSKATFRLEKLEAPKAKTPVATSTQPPVPAASVEPATPSAPATVPETVAPPAPYTPPVSRDLVFPSQKKSSGVWFPVVLIAVLVIAGVAMLKGRMKKAMR